MNFSPQILYEDNHLIAVNKPAGLLTQPTKQETESLEMQLKSWLKAKYQKPGNVFLGVIHRLDRPVSGIVLFAKTSKALSRLNESLRNHQFKKVYMALVEGKLPKEERQLEHYLRHDDFKACVSNAQDKDAKQARLSYKVIETQSQATLIEVTLETGRYHQIRVQCAASGFPIIGDKKYGSRFVFSDEAIALHHARLCFDHPISRVGILIKAALPRNWKIAF